MGKKRGQATIFIILGLVIVVFIGILFYVKQDLVKQKIEELGFKGTVVPERIQTVVFYVDSCLISLGKEGMNIMGRQGGYIELPNEFNYNPERYLQVDEFSRNPYWLSRYGSKIPTNEFMEGQLKQYIEDNFDKCNLDSFTGIGYKFSIKELDIAVKINKEDVGIRLNSDFDTKIGEDVFSLKDYIDGKISIPFGRILETGNKIVDKEVSDGSLEFNTINLIAAYSHDKRSGIPPVSGLDFDCTKKVWAEPVVEGRLKEMLTENIIYLNVPDAESAYTRSKEVFYQSLDWDIKGDFKDIEINFYYYPVWGMDLDVYPKNKGVIESSNLGLTTWLMTFCMNMYNFRYDIKYPVLVEVVDKKNDYVFQFPIEVDVVDNYKRERLFSIEEDAQKISLFCDLNQRNSGIIKVNTFDGLDGGDLGDVDVIYECGPDSCSIGKTEKSLYGAILESRFPTCYNGILNLYKEDYVAERKLLTTDEKGNNLDIILEPIRTKKARAEVMINGRRGLNDDETLFVELNKKNIELGDYDYSFATQIDKNGGNIEIVPGLYDVSLILFTNKQIKLSSEKFSYGIWPFRKSVEIPEQTFDGLMLGKNNFEWNVDKDDLDQNNQIVFIIKSNDIPQRYSDLENLYNEEEDWVMPEYAQ